MESFAKENPKLDLFETLSRGRGIRANNSFKAGSTILSCLPYLSVSKSDLQGRICDACLTVKDGGLQRCSSCKSIYYCGKTCQKSAWNVHKLECKYLKEISPKIPGDSSRLLALLLLKNVANEVFFQHLVSHGDEIKQGKHEMFAHILTMLRKYLKISEEVKSEMIFDVFCKVHCNTFTICDEEMKPIGLGLYSTASFLNHSCQPNCVVIFLGPKCLVRTIEHIQSGEEVCISYTELLRPCRIRRKELRQQYFFVCKCPRCEQEETNGSPMNSLKCTQKQCLNVVGLFGPDLIENSCNVCGSHITSCYSPLFNNELNNKIDASLKDTTASQPESQKKALEDCERLLSDAEKFLQPMNYQVLKIIDKASDLCIETGLWSKALHYCKRSLLGYQQFYPKNHPSVGLQLYRIGKLEIFLDMFDSGLHSLSEAQKVLNVCYGKMHPLSQKLDELMFKTAEEKQLFCGAQPNVKTLTQ